MFRVKWFLVAFAFIIVVLLFDGCKPEGNYDNVKVVTYTPKEVTRTTARCGGEVILPQNLSLSEIGVCWSIDRNPTVEGSHLTAVNWNEPLVCTVKDLEPFTVYHVRAYALCGSNYYYGDDVSFITEGDSNVHYVDLGLPSGILWACCNMGADAPEDFGDYYAWGETETKDAYDWSTYKYCVIEEGVEYFTKYCIDPHFGYNHYVDYYYDLQAKDDAVAVNWGGGWHTPNTDEWNELMDYTTHEWITKNGVNGMLLTAINESGNTLFLPAVGYCDGCGFVNSNDAFYWSSSFCVTPPTYAWSFFFYNEGLYIWSHSFRYYGHAVRAVRVPQE